MEIIFFWVAWGIISFWALKTFYYSFSKEKLKRLRKTALGINLAVLVLTFLPWLPQNLGAKSGFLFALEGNVFGLLFVIFLIASIVFFLTKDALLLKIGSTTAIVSTFLLFIIMYQLRPETFVMTLYDIAPIIAMLFLLVNDVVILLLWQQLQLKKKMR